MGHCRHFGILFDTSDLPTGTSLTAAAAWRQHRNHGPGADLFGHGDATGGRFLWVNLAGDYLALNGRETSMWDSWREAAARRKRLDDAERLQCDRLAGLIEAAEVQRESTRLQPHAIEPFWRATTAVFTGEL
jgi:hypothetical protein